MKAAGLALDDSRLFKQQCLVDGAWVAARDATTMPVFNPADGSSLGTVPMMSASEISAAIERADVAWQSWRNTLAAERARLLRAWHGEIIKHREDLARILTAEQGKPLAESRMEIGGTAAFVEWFAEEAKRVSGDTLATHHVDKRLFVIKQPVGVCAAITPWNFPSSMVTRKVAPALAAGCTVILKPAEQTPYSALALAELAQRAGIPAGVLNVVTGDPPTIGKVLTASADIRKLAFTGSTEVGRLLMRDSADTVKKLSLELGGNAPFIVFDDADLDAVVEAVRVCKFRNAGQTCVSANRLLVQRGIHDELAKRLVEVARTLNVGPGNDPASEVGPLIDEDSARKVEACMQDALDKGAHIAAGGARHARGNTFFQPTVVTRVSADMKLFTTEIFGPVAPLFVFDTEQQAVSVANATEYGLAAYVFTRDVGRVWRMSERLEFGMVSVNTGSFATEVAPFGGMKQSGMGREASHYGIEEFLEVKYVCLGGIEE